MEREQVQPEMPESHIDISVIIPARNAAGRLEKCLEALQRQETKKSYEIIVVDDGSSDTTSEIAASFGVALLKTPGKGPAYARNLGAHHARGDLLLFTDADCVPESDWIQKMAKPFENPEIAGVKGAYLTDQTRPMARFVQAEYEYKYRYMASFKYIDFVDTYSAGFRKDIFLAMGGFDETFPGASVEDQEFSFRLAKAGHKMVFVPNARVRHTHADTLWKYIRKKFNIGFWKIKILRILPEKALHDSHTPQLLKLQIPVAFLVVGLFCLTPFLGWLPFLFAGIVFIALSAREILNFTRREGWKAPCQAMVFLFLRSLALGAGMAKGLFSHWTQRGKRDGIDN